MIINKITYKKNEFLVEFNNGKSVSIVEDSLVKFNLYKGLEVSDDFDNSLYEQDQLTRAFILACRYLSNIKSSKQIKDYLYRKKISNDNIEKTIDLLTEKGFLDDYSYAVSYIHDAQILKKHGRKKIKYSLFEKGISKNIIEKASAEIDDELEYNNAHELFLKKANNDYSFENLNKVIRFLLARGFDYSIIKEVINYEKER